MGRRLSDEQRRILAQHIARAFEERNWTQVRLAEKAGYDPRVIRGILAGHSAKFDTYAAVCTAVDLDIRKLLEVVETPTGKDIAPEAMGGYSRKMYDHYLGEYVTIRPKYNDTSVIKSYLTRITWDASQSCYCYEERNRLDAEYNQLGQLYIPLASSCLYLVTIDRGWVRTVVVSQMFAGGAVEMRGLITSQFNVSGPAFAPVCAPIAYLKIGDKTAPSPSFGELTRLDPQYDRYMRILQDILQSSFVHVAFPPTSLPSPKIVPLPSRQGST